MTSFFGSTIIPACLVFALFCTFMRRSIGEKDLADPHLEPSGDLESRRPPRLTQPCESRGKPPGASPERRTGGELSSRF